MHGYLLSRETGSLPPSQLQRIYCDTLLQSLHPTATNFERVKASVPASQSQSGESQEETADQAIAHHGGVNSIAIDRFEGRWLLSGGADASVAIWDLETPHGSGGSAKVIYKPIASVGKSAKTHSHGITQLSFYSGDSGAFLSSSYDHTLKVWDSVTFEVNATFNLESVVYAHAISPIAQHVNVACATQHPAVRLVDLRSGAAIHSLAGHTGAVLSVAWSPVDEYVLASAGTDGTVKLWDIRRSAPLLATLDMEDSVGVLGHDRHGTGARHRSRGKAHDGPVNGIVWTKDGRHMVTTGHDEKVRVWDIAQGSNTLANFGPLIKNKNFSQSLPCLAAPEIVATGKEVMFYPSEREILMYELHEGKLLKRLRPPGASATPAQAGKMTQRQRVVDLAWREHNVELYSAHGTGTIRVWKPRTEDDILADEDERQEREKDTIVRDQKRKALEEVFQNFAKKKVNFNGI